MWDLRARREAARLQGPSAASCVDVSNTRVGVSHTRVGVSNNRIGVSKNSIRCIQHSRGCIPRDLRVRREAARLKGLSADQIPISTFPIYT